MASDDIVQPPATFTVEDVGRPVLYLPDGTPLRRQIGFAMQTTGTFPETGGNTSYGKGKGGKTPKSGGKKS